MARGSLIALTGVETRRLLLHPLVLGGLALSLAALVVGAGHPGQHQHFFLLGVLVLPLAMGTFAAANLAAMRSRRAGAEELLDALPAGVATRTGAQLLAVLALVPLTAALVAAGHLVFGAGDGLVIGWQGLRREPALVELAQGPLVVLALGALGVLLGRLAPVALLAALLVVAVLFAEVPLAAWGPDSWTRWLVPVANDMVAVPDTWVQCEPYSTYECGQIDHFDTGGMAWHLVALAGVAVAAGAAALVRGRGARLGIGAAALAFVATTTALAAA